MGIGTREQYIKRLREQNPEIHMGGKRVENMVDDPHFMVGINSIATTYDSANDPAYEDLATVKSSLIGVKISRWTHILENQHDAVAKVKLMRKSGESCCFCNYRCLTNDTLNTAWIISYDIDKKYNTNYHSRVREIVKRVQKEDLAIGGTVIDCKGVRTLKPSEQPDPDVYLHLVEKRKDGIIVRGAKAHSTAVGYTNMLCALPCIAMGENEKDYAVAFFAPVDTKGIKFIARPSPVPSEKKKFENPISSKYGHVEFMAIYDNVFIPWENVFMCGEYEFSGQLVLTFTGHHILNKCGCRAAAMELDIGATALVAEVNGVEKASHIRGYISEMMVNTELVYSCGIASAVDGVTHESGAFIPNFIPAFASKYYAAKKLGEHRYYMQDTAGGLVETMSSEKDILEPETGKYLEKYLKGKEGVPTENRIRAIKLIEELTASPFAGWYHAMCISGGGGPQLLKQAINYAYDVKSLVKRAKSITGIED